MWEFFQISTSLIFVLKNLDLIWFQYYLDGLIKLIGCAIDA